MALRFCNYIRRPVAILQQSPLAVEIFYSSPVRGCRLTIRSRIISVESVLKSARLPKGLNIIYVEQ